MKQPVAETAVKPLPHQIPDITKTRPPGTVHLPAVDSSLTPAQTSERLPLARRHSLSILDKTPPPNFLAAEILGSSKTSLKMKSNVLSNN